MSKKTLNEATVRQFMKLVNHKPATISNFINERYNEEQTDPARDPSYQGHIPPEEEKDYTYKRNEAVEVEDEAPVDAEAGDLEAPPADDMEMPPEADGEALGEGEIDITPEMAEVLIELGDMLKSAMPEAGAGEEEIAPVDDEMPPAPPEAELDAEIPPPEGEEEEPMMEEEEKMVQEVARRVASRILKAKKAKKDLDDALGNK